MNAVQLKSVHPKRGSPPEVQLQSASHRMATTTSLQKDHYTTKNKHTQTTSSGFMNLKKQ
jgi:hypothetical protein